MKKLVLILVIMTSACIGFAADDLKDTKSANVQLTQDVASPETTESVSGCTPTEVADGQRVYKPEGSKDSIHDTNSTSGTYKQ